MDSGLVFFGALLKNFGFIAFLGASILVIYLAFQDTLKRGLLCLLPPYHLYYALERLRHPWKKYINRVLFGGFLAIIIGFVLSQGFPGEALGTSLFNGIVNGSQYALMAFAIILIFKTTDLVNFAQGEMATVGVFVLLTFLGERFGAAASGEETLWLPFGVAILLMVIFALLFGGLTEIIFVKPIQKQHPISQIILTLGLNMAIISGIGIIWDQEQHTVRNILTLSSGESFFKAAGVNITLDGLLSIGVTLVFLVIIFALFKYTLLGIALRATAQSQTTSKLMGINVNQVFIFSWMTSVAVASMAAMFFSVGKPGGTDSHIGTMLLLKGFSAAVMGGFSSLPGAVLGGFLLGVLDNFLGLFSNMREAWSFLIIVLILIIKPEGLFGGGGQSKKV